MKLFTIIKFTATLSLLSMSIVSSASINKSDIVDTCVKTGDDIAICECVSNKWLDSLTSSEMKIAEKLIGYMKTDTQPSARDMEKYSSVMNKYRKMGMQCAMSVEVEEEEEDFDIGAFIPKGAMSSEDMKDLNSIMSGNGDMMDKLKSMDNRNQQRKESERAQRASEQAQSDAKLAKLKAQYKAEKKSVESKPILKQDRQDFKQLFDLHARVYGASSSESACMWNQLLSVTSDNASGVLAVYFASIGGGDFDQPPEHRPHLNDAFDRYQAYQDKRNMCD